ncbi:hypothetical protein [Abyssibius alkaniclasticus]|uniref:hypothetical protein n=1 Tax=Abyssibius alkaniclasticus TaxID=2881234 RepID=UPI00405A2D5A|tara:strand:+ start:1615 stop:2064 length:450 start_codon:yes stop_codon:yes gene_type:complete
MSYEEKNSIISLIVTIGVFGYYGVRFSGLYAEGYFTGPEAMTRTGWEILYLIGYGIIAQIIGQIVLTILFSILANDPKPSFVVDERDRLISLRGVRFGYAFAGGGVTLSIVALAFGWDPVIVFNLVIFSIAAGAFVETLVKVVLYRIGG